MKGFLLGENVSPQLFEAGYSSGEMVEVVQVLDSGNVVIRKVQHTRGGKVAPATFTVAGDQIWVINDPLYAYREALDDSRTDSIKLERLQQQVWDAKAKAERSEHRLTQISKLVLAHIAGEPL